MTTPSEAVTAIRTLMDEAVERAQATRQTLGEFNVNTDHAAPMVLVPVADLTALLGALEDTTTAAWDEGVAWARKEIKRLVPDVPFHTHVVVQPHFDALDAVPGGLRYSGYNDHITHVALTSAIDFITPNFNPPEGYEPDDDPNPYRAALNAKEQGL